MKSGGIVALVVVTGIVALTHISCRPKTAPIESRAEVAAAPPPSARAPDVPDANAPKGAQTPKPPCSAQHPEAATVASSDGKTVVFVETDPSRTDPTTTSDVPHARLCIVKDGAPPRVLLEGHSSPSAPPEEILAGFDNLVLSPNSATLYVTTEAWVTSPAAHAVDVATGKQRFLFDGSVVEVLADGPFNGNLLAAHMRLDSKHPIESPEYRGRMETWTIESPAGKTIRELPEDEAARDKVLKRH